MLLSYQQKSKVYENEFEKLKCELIEKDEIISELETKLNLIARDRDQLKHRTESLLEENSKINQEMKFLNENVSKLDKWKKNILNTIAIEKDEQENNFGIFNI